MRIWFVIENTKVWEEHNKWLTRCAYVSWYAVYYQWISGYGLLSLICCSHTTVRLVYSGFVFEVLLWTWESNSWRPEDTENSETRICLHLKLIVSLSLSRTSCLWQLETSKTWVGEHLCFAICLTKIFWLAFQMTRFNTFLCIFDVHLITGISTRESRCLCTKRKRRASWGGWIQWARSVSG